ncbi:PilZ domain-containing protein [Natronospira bacteriovora]|uniref:PilZ domain-containing protein n=1 Tax=Natronospira bacteriovora TaxID=3069753 RepID=A0ABU0W8G2_9GAMM|nr:PilZ domain-containing protein [Natronospira sp. AB-CW4]MDQ2070247.1 PilZ domain-containing protein [Natronospira sp. AB-CW4]
MSEQRQFQRMPADAEAVLESDPVGARGQVVNLSLAGAAIRLRPTPRLQAGDRMRLRVLLSAEVRFQGELVVTWCNEDAVGGYWAALDSEGLSHLRRMLTLNTGNPAAVQAELRELIRHRRGQASS